LPGVPAIVAGSNGHVAWGFTNSYGQWFDWVKVPAHADLSQITHLTETIAVKGGADVKLDITQFAGLPVVEKSGAQSYALSWVADYPEAYGLALDRMLRATQVFDALEIGVRSGIPEQNLVVADSQGKIGWTIAGALTFPREPAAQGFGRFLSEAGLVKLLRPQLGESAAGRGIVMEDPYDGLLWTANARTYEWPPRDESRMQQARGGIFMTGIGDGGYDLGARAQQIRDRLKATDKFDEKTLGAIHFDDEALFLRPWAGRIAAVAASPTARPEVTTLLKDWNGRADADQAGYRLVSEVRKRVLDALWMAWSQPLTRAGQCPVRRYDWHARFEYSAEEALDKQPAHLLPRGFASWDAFLLAQVDATVADMTRNGARPLAQATWGEVNRSRVGHVLSRALPILSAFLDMPSLPQSGDRNMPHVAAPSFGQSERLVVAPGHEERATLSMPGGQSGHPMSPYYGAGHDDWVAGRATPLLAGAPQHVLTLTP